MLTALGSLLFSSKGVMVKIAFAHGAAPLAVLGLRMAFALPIFMAIAWREDRVAVTPLPRMERLRAMGCGLIGYHLASWLDFEGLRLISVALERMVLYAYPTAVILISALVFKQRISRMTMAAMALAYVGVAVACGGEAHAGPGAWLGIVLVGASAGSYAVFIVASSRAMRALGSMRFMANAMCGACAAVLAHASLACSASDLRVDGTVWALGVALALLGTVAPALLCAEGLKRAGPQAFAVISSVGPVCTVALAWAFLDEQPRPVQLIGMALTMGACLALALTGSAPVKANASVPIEPDQPRESRRCATAASSPAANGASR